MSEPILVHKNRTNVLTINLGVDVSIYFNINPRELL